MALSIPDVMLRRRLVLRTFVAGAMSLIVFPLSPALGVAQRLPADGTTATARLDASPRHGEWVMYDAGDGDQVQAWVTYPERSDAAPVVVVIHDIRAMSDWARAVADQLSADGFIAIVPDLLSGKGRGGAGTGGTGGGREALELGGPLGVQPVQ